MNNACRVDLALGGSTNTALHLPAIAHEAKVDFGLADFDRLSRQTPHLASMSPGGPMRLEHLHAAGGIGAVMKALEPVINTSCKAVGGTIAAYLAAEASNMEAGGLRIIHTMDQPVHDQGGIAVLRGNLAPPGRGDQADGSGPGDDAPLRPGPLLRPRGSGHRGLQRPGRSKRAKWSLYATRGLPEAPACARCLALTALISGGALDGKGGFDHRRPFQRRQQRRGHRPTSRPRRPRAA